MDLNKKIVELSDLSCSLCENILNLPIMMNKDDGNNICGRCFTTENDSDYIKNIKLEKILIFLSIPCRNKSKGCNKNLPYDDMIVHEENCLYQPYDCPTKDDCSWNDVIMNLQEHFEDCHYDLLFKLDALHFEFDIKLSDDLEKNMLLVFNSEMFLLQIKVENYGFWCALCYIGKENKESNYKYIIEKIGLESGFYFGNVFKSMLRKKYMDKIYLDKAININIDLLRSFLSTDDVTVKLRITNEYLVDKVHEIDEQLLTQFECPVCKLYMVSIIHLCTNGHSICSRCRLRVNQCPICRGTIGGNRNFALEAINSLAKFPCVYRSNGGCSVVLPGAQLSQHEQQCTLRIYNCLIKSSSCDWKGKYYELINHLQITHQIGDSYETIDAYENLDSLPLFKFVIAQKEIFKIGYKYSEDTEMSHWNCRLIRPNRLNNNKFKFRITYSDETKENLYIRTALCSPFTVNDEFFNNSLKFSKNQTDPVGNHVRLDIIKSSS